MSYPKMMSALIFGLCFSMRAMAVSTTSTGDISLRRMRPTRLAADSVLARSSVCMLCPILSRSFAWAVDAVSAPAVMTTGDYDVSAVGMKPL